MKRKAIGFLTKTKEAEVASRETDSSNEEAWIPQSYDLPEYREENENRLNFFLNMLMAPDFSKKSEDEKLSIAFNIAYYSRAIEMYSLLNK